MVFVGQKQQKFLEMTKSFERDFIFARLHNFKKFNISLKVSDGRIQTNRSIL